MRDDVPVSSTRDTAATIAAQREASRRLALTKRMREAEEAILARAPEHDLQPSLDRIQAVMELLGGGTVTIAEIKRLVGGAALDIPGYFLLGIVVLVIAALCMLTSRIGVYRILNSQH